MNSFSLISAQVQFMVRRFPSFSLPLLLASFPAMRIMALVLRLFSLTTIVEVQEHRLALVHIPLELYPYFLKPILQVLFDEVSPIKNEDADAGVSADDGPILEEDEEEEEEYTATPEQPAFLNISITPVECSVMCPRKLAEQYFAPLIARFAPSELLSITQDDFIAMQVYGEGLEAGQRVLELTSPLAMAGISIFFVSTYFSDYIIVPYRSKTQVIQALEKRGFTFEISTETFASNSHHHQFNRCFSSPASSRSGSTSLGSPPSTPPPSTLEELQARTFSSLRKNRIVASVDRSLRLVQCAAHRPYTSDASSISILRDALITSLVVDQPRFLSLTLTAADPAASLLLEKRLLPRFFPSSSNSSAGGGDDSASENSATDDESGLLLGSKDDILVPIMLDLRSLPLQATGIVCGVASRLAEATHTTTSGQTEVANLSSSSTSIAALSSTNTNSSSFDSYVKAVFSSSADSSTETVAKKQHALTPSTHRLQPDFDTSLNAAVEVSFLSTARAGTILVGEHELQRAVEALEAETESQSPEDGVEVQDADLLY